MNSRFLLLLLMSIMLVCGSSCKDRSLSSRARVKQKEKEGKDYSEFSKKIETKKEAKKKSGGAFSVKVKRAKKNKKKKGDPFATEVADKERGPVDDPFTTTKRFSVKRSLAVVSRGVKVVTYTLLGKRKKTKTPESDAFAYDVRKRKKDKKKKKETGLFPNGVLPKGLK